MEIFVSEQIQCEYKLPIIVYQRMFNERVESKLNFRLDSRLYTIVQALIYDVCTLINSCIYICRFMVSACNRNIQYISAFNTLVLIYMRIGQNDRKHRTFR